MKWLILPLLSTLLGGSLAACSNPVCEAEILNRLLDECKVRIGAANPGVCGPFPDMDETGVSESLRRLSRELCEIQDPETLDADCLRTVSCEQLAQGNACRTDANDPSPAPMSCLAGCGEVQIGCEASCANEAHEACTDCVLRCATEREACAAECR